MSDKLRVGILGGTGMVGQRFISLLENHPWFEVVVIAASPRSAGKTYEEAVGGRWKMQTPMPEAVKKIVVRNVNEVENVSKDVDFVFSAVDMTKEEIKKIEEEYAKTETPVVSNNSAHRWTPDVPMIVPEINPEHLEVIESQKKRLGTKRGFVCVKPNCSIQSYAPALTAWRKFEPTVVVATTYQAISGAGKTFKDWPEMEHNIIPYIGGEEEKSEQEPLRLWGKVVDGKIEKAQTPLITSQCIRVPVLDGHTAAAFVNFKQKPTKEELIQALVEFKGAPQELNLPSAPKQFIQYLEEDDRPQVALDVNYENGFGVSIGRLREDSYFDWKFDHYLVVEKWYDDRIFDPYQWEFIDGTIEFSETPEKAVQRVVEEKTGLSVLVDKPLYTWGFTVGEVCSVGIAFECTSQSEEVILAEDLNDFKWVTKEELSEVITNQAVLKDIEEMKSEMCMS